MLYKGRQSLLKEILTQILWRTFIKPKNGFFFSFGCYNTADIPVLHSVEVVHLYSQDVIPLSPRVDQTLKHYQCE
jgi:hypothetical protein